METMVIDIMRYSHVYCNKNVVDQKEKKRLRVKFYCHSLSVTPETIICPSLLGSLSPRLCLSVLLLKPISR